LDINAIYQYFRFWLVTISILLRKLTNQTGRIPKWRHTAVCATVSNAVPSGNTSN